MAAIVQGQELAENQMRAAMNEMMGGSFGEVESAAFLIGMRLKGATAGELAAAARVLRENMVRLETGKTGILDTCGTGGKSTSTFNISTAAALGFAGADIPGVEHRNL